MPLWVRFYFRGVRFLGRFVWLPLALRSLRRKRAQLVRPTSRWNESLETLELQPDQLERVCEQLDHASEVVLAEIDQDGFFHSRIGPIPWLPSVSSQDFLRRTRTRLELVATRQYVGVKKHHGRNRWRFLNEVRSLSALETSECRVPKLLKVDFDELSVTVSYVPGAVLREALAERSAAIRDRDITQNGRYKELQSRELWRARIDEGRRVLYDVVDRDFVDRLGVEIRRMHAHRVVWGDVKYGNVIIERKTGLPFLIDFDSATHYPYAPEPVFRALCRQELDMFRLHFDQGEHPTASLPAPVRRSAYPNAR